MDQQEIMFKFQMLEQKVGNLREQIQAVEQGMVELSGLSLGLEELKGKTGEEIYAELGRGIFIKTKLLSEDVIVDVGNKNFVGKSIPDTKKLIEEQLENLEKAKESLNKEIEEAQKEISGIIDEAQKLQAQEVDKKN